MVLPYGELPLKKNINKLYVVQKKAIRLIAKANYNAHTEPIFYKFKILKIEDIYKYNVSQYMYSYILKTLPLSLLNKYKYVGTREGYPNTRAKMSKYTLERVKGRSQCFLQSILSNGPKIWNNIPNRLYINMNNLLVSTHCFKSMVKRNIVANYCSL